MAESFDKHILANGMVVLGDRMESVESAAFDFMLPCGAAMLPKGCCGAGTVIGDWIFRGAGDKTSKELQGTLDGLGLHRAISVGSSHIAIGAALEASNLSAALDLYGDIILRPSLLADQFEPARELTVNEVKSLDDNPRRNVMLKLREQFYPEPLGRSPAGEIEELNALTAEKATQIINDNFNPSRTIFTVAGKYDFETVCGQIERLFGEAEVKAVNEIAIGDGRSKYRHIEIDSAQVHIGVMTGTVRPNDEDYYNARVAVSVLSGGMSARLFTEVREKRGLCYAIGARYHGLKQAAGIACYAGTTPDKTQQTLDVVIGEFKRLSEGISEEEIDRAKVGLKSSLIMQSESSSSRATAIGNDYYILGRVRSLDEIKNRIEQTSVDSVAGFLRDNKFTDFTAVTIGPKKVSLD